MFSRHLQFARRTVSFSNSYAFSPSALERMERRSARLTEPLACCLAARRS
jgi:hypothetical protein